MNPVAASGTGAHGPTVVAMRPRRALLTAAAAIGVAAAVTACTATGTPAAAPGTTASATAGPTATRAQAPVYGPDPDTACVAAKQAEQTLQSRQTKDQNDESALDQDFTNFASALNADAQREKSQATAAAMTALASDYTDLVESQSGAAQLPDMTQVQKDGAAFDKACS
jgi:negative regulator of sigma E activity